MTLEDQLTRNIESNQKHETKKCFLLLSVAHVPEKATTTFLRSASLNRALSISAPSSCGVNINSRTSIGSGGQAVGVSPGGWPSPGVDERVQDNGSTPRRHQQACRAHFRSNGILLTPIDSGTRTPRMSDAPYASDSSPSSLLKGTTEDTPQGLPCAVSFPSVLPR